MFCFQDKVRSELSTGPEGQVNTRIVVGKLPPRSRRKPHRPNPPFPPPRYPVALKKSDYEMNAELSTEPMSTKRPKNSIKRSKASTRTPSPSTTSTTSTTKRPPTMSSMDQLSFSSLISMKRGR